MLKKFKCRKKLTGVAVIPFVTESVFIFHPVSKYIHGDGKKQMYRSDECHVSEQFSVYSLHLDGFPHNRCAILFTISILANKINNVIAVKYPLTGYTVETDNII